jgi:cytochrome oxidase Cu insertion factor (SCO1/SenC/PrrC family)
MRNRAIALVLALGLALVVNPVLAQERESQNTDVLAPGMEAPDFALPGATRYGALANEVRLSDYRGQVVVLAFFFRVRTKG